jgi:tetratricopeptide (TPR) repeat protein
MKIVPLFFAAATTLFAQQGDIEARLRLGQSYERAGDWENAVRVYEELYARDSANVVFFENLRRSYLQLKRHTDAIRIIQSRLRIRPNDVALLAQLGSVYARDGDEANAVAAWDRALAVDRRSLNGYYVVSNSAIESRMFERAIGFYQRGRTELGDPMLFTAEIASLHALTMNFGEATREYLKLIRQNAQQLPFVQTRMAGYTYRPEGRREALKVVEEALRTEGDNIALYQLYAWLLMEGKEFDRAFQVYRQIDERSQAGGRELYTFAERILRERAFSVAAAAFRAIIDNHPRFERMPAARFGYARALEESLVGRDSTAETQSLLFTPMPDFVFIDQSPNEVRTKYETILASYQAIVRDYPRTEFAAQALSGIARIRFERFFDVDGAIATWQQIIREYSHLPQFKTLAILSCGDGFLARRELDEAEKQYRFLIAPGAANAEVREKAQLRLGELAFFRGNFGESVKLLQDAGKNPNSNAANDALMLLVFIQQNSSDSAMKDFAKATLLIRQRQLPEAANLLQRIRSVNPNSSFIDEVLMTLGDTFVGMNRHAEAVATYEELVREHPESIALDRAQINIARVFQWKLNDKPGAISAYQTLLEKFPGSIYANEARKRIRELRGDSL